MDNNVLVIGNGYDLAHGLKTKYEHFIDWLKGLDRERWCSIMHCDVERYDRISDNGFVKYFLEYKRDVMGWVDVEHLIYNIICDFEDFFLYESDFLDSRGRIQIDVLHTTDIRQRRILNCIVKFPVVNANGGIGSKVLFELRESYYSINYGLNKKEIVRFLKKQLDELIFLLQVYLKEHMGEVRSDLKAKRQLAEINPDYTISFNYTNTYKIYGINDEDVFHVHGSLEKDNIVLGYNDDKEDLDFVYFKKYFQRIQKLTGYVDERRMVKFNNGVEIRPLIHFYGHSMDNTDGDIIRNLRTLARGFRIYRYSQEDYELKVINLFDVFGKDSAMHMIQDGYILFVDCEE